IDFENGHTGDWTAGIVACIRVDDVVCSDHDRDICGWKFRIDLFELIQRRVRHICLSKQHVHVSGHAARNGMNSVFDCDSAFLQYVCELTHCVLRLRCSQTITRHEHNLVCISELRRDVFQSDFAHRPLLLAGGCGCRSASESTEQDVCHRA